MADKPTGMSMMLKALGVSPEVFTNVSKAVETIAQAIQSINDKCDELLRRTEELERKLNARLTDTHTNASTNGAAQPGNASIDASGGR